MEEWHLLVWSPWASLPSMALAHDTAALALKKGQNLPWNPIFMRYSGSWLLQLSSRAGVGRTLGHLGRGGDSDVAGHILCPCIFRG